MTTSCRLVAVVVMVLVGAAVKGQAPPAEPDASAAAPGFDISGYWTSPLHEDVLERGAGPELGDYGGAPNQ